MVRLRHPDPVHCPAEQTVKRKLATGIALPILFQYYGSLVFLESFTNAFLDELVPALREYVSDTNPQAPIIARTTDLGNFVPLRHLSGLIQAQSDAMDTMFVSSLRSLARVALPTC